MSGPAASGGGKRVAVMQPYFLPYAGYFGLFATVDEFIVLDSVQFPRRGRVHRTQLIGPGGEVEWLTLPLARQARDVLIRDLEFRADARAELDARLARHEPVARGTGPLAPALRQYLHGPLDSVVSFLERGLRLVTGALGLETAMTRSSELGLDTSLRGQDRIIAAAASRGAAVYVNPSGGRALYDASAFAAAGIELRFLEPYAGRFRHLLPALAQEEPATLRADILAQTRVSR